MLLLIALANVHLFGYGEPDRACAATRASSPGWTMRWRCCRWCLVDGRAYPLFGLLFGYGIVQLAGGAARPRLPRRR